MRRIVVAGGGTAGLAAAHTLRDEGFDGAITVLDDSPSEMVDGVGPRGVVVTDIVDDWRSADPATGLDPLSGHVRTRCGVQLPFDGLVIATGCRPVQEPSAWSVSAGDHDVAGMVVLVGAGYNAADDISPVTRLGLSPVVIQLPQAVRDATGSWPPRGSHRADSGGGRLVVVLGAPPNIGWLEGSGLTLVRAGVVCDSTCTTPGFDRIVAAGDVVTWVHHSDGGRTLQVEHWNDAAGMAATAARNLLRPPDERRSHRSEPALWTDRYGRRYSYGPVAGTLPASGDPVDDHLPTGVAPVIDHRRRIDSDGACRDRPARQVAERSRQSA